MSKLLPGKLPDPPREYNQAKLNQIVRKIQQALGIPITTQREGEDREAMDFFLSK